MRAVDLALRTTSRGEVAMLRTFGVAHLAAAVAVMALGASIPCAAWAQISVPSFDQLGAAVKIGDTVYVTDTTGREHKGKVSALSAASLTIETGGAFRDFPAESIQAIARRKRDSLLTGALIGAGVGVVAGWAQAQGAEAWDFEMPNEFAYYALFAGMGAGVGIAVDAMIPGKKVTIYPATPASLTAKIHVLPICAPGRRGIAVRLVF
jgi:hypothetical protein